MNLQIEKRALKSHVAHEKHMINLINEKDKRLFLLKNKDCVGYFLNTRTLEILNPILKVKNTWLTIGDYNGFEAKYFQEHNQSVTASDISDVFLKEAKAENLIEGYRKENAEQISLPEDSIDYVSCREAFHHFPRAYLAVYEMIRVAKKGVIIIEPIDILSKLPLFLLIKNITDLINPLLINKIWKNRFSWETVGNYVFKISEREVEKIAMGIGLPCIAFKEINILHTVKEDTQTVPTNRKLLRKVKLKLRLLDLPCVFRIIPYNTLCSVIFKEMPNDELLKDLKKIGYKIIKLPPNPYLK
ncbi:MAG: class I SAM-dependent methyltransferase [Bacteroidales bacterium]